MLYAIYSLQHSSDDFFTFNFSRYPPLRLFASGEEARYTIVSAPFSGLVMNNFGRAIMNPTGPRGLLQMLVTTVPGCTALTVTPVPWSFLASSSVNRTRASLDCPYAFHPPYSFSKLISSKLMCPL